MADSERIPGAPTSAASEVLFDRAPCGYLETDRHGLITAINQTLLEWTGFGRDQLIGLTRFSELLTGGGRMYHETHYAPMLAMQGHARQIALDIVCADGRRLPTLINAVVDDGATVRIAVFDATDRRQYERELLAAMKRAEASEERAKRLAETLQQTLIPPALPHIEGLELAAAYRPAGDGTEVGGDFYDVFRLGTDDWLVAIGDVEGKGVGAAVVTALARYTVRAAAADHELPSEILRSLNRALRHHESGRTCTAVVVRLRYHEAGWHVQVSTAGHAPPLLRSRDAVVEIGPPGPLLGFFDEVSLSDTELVLDHGDAVLLYTDGVSEARRGPNWYGDERVADLLKAGTTSAASITTDLLSDVLEFQTGNPRDDIAIVAIVVAETDEFTGATTS